MIDDFTYNNKRLREDDLITSSKSDKLYTVYSITEDDPPIVNAGRVIIDKDLSLTKTPSTPKLQWKYVKPVETWDAFGITFKVGELYDLAPCDIYDNIPLCICRLDRFVDYGGDLGVLFTPVISCDFYTEKDIADVSTLEGADPVATTDIKRIVEKYKKELDKKVDDLEKSLGILNEELISSERILL